MTAVWLHGLIETERIRDEATPRPGSEPVAPTLPGRGRDVIDGCRRALEG
ncbi:MAG: hypothetical protein HOW97_40530 [Catenulispora sp.]|nr:hypothetical protein [Catenulispora sp.]